MNKDSVWGFLLVLGMLLAVFIYYKWVWWLDWRRSRGTLPMYGQIWASPMGKRLYVTGVEKKSGDLEPAVIFVDEKPRGQAQRQYRWSMTQWKQEVHVRELVLLKDSWMEDRS